MAVLFYQSSVFSEQHFSEKMYGEFACLKQNPVQEAAEYPGLSLVRVGEPGESVFWILYHAVSNAAVAVEDGADHLADQLIEAEDDATFREPADWGGQRGEPVAFLRDDNGDAHPDTAFLFLQESSAPKIARLNGDLWSAERGCRFWKKPTAHLQKWALDEHNWTPSLAKEHQWVAFLNRLSQIHIEKSSDEELRKLKGLPSRVSEQSAAQLFELLSETVAHQDVGPQFSEKDYWTEAQATAHTVLSWVGLRVKSAGRAGVKAQVQAEGYSRPLSLPSYSAPALDVEFADETNDGAKPVVLDVLLFNGWAPQETWEERVKFGT